MRFGFTVEERTQRQYDNAREAELEKLIPGRVLFEELRSIADEPNAGEIMRELERAGLLAIFSAALAGPKLSVRFYCQAGEATQAAAGVATASVPPA